MAWLTEAEETALVNRLAQSGRLTVETVGTSVQGRPVRLLRVGYPPPAADNRAALLHIGGQHGNEPAPREALLGWARSLVDAGPYLSLTGTSGDYASTPHAAALAITGDLSLRAEAAVADWGAAIQTLVGKYVTTGDQRAYRLTTTTPSGLLRLYWSTDGTAFETRDSTVAIPAVDADRIALRADLDVDNDNGGHTVRFWWAHYLGAAWQELGTPVTTAGTTSVFNATSAPLELGASNNGAANMWAGRLWGAEVRDSAGAVVADPRLQEQALAAGSFADDAGRTWTINGSAAIASILTSDELAFLASTGVLLIPTMNPDGIAASTRNNANGVDLNRDHIALIAPETRAVATVQGRNRPAVTFDQHETTLTNNEGHDITFMPTSSTAAVGDMVDTGIVAETDALLLVLRARCAAETWDDGDWVTVGDERRLTRMAWLRHSVAIVVETTGLGTSPQPDQDRIDQHRAMAEEALGYVTANDVIAVADTAAANAAAAGAAGTAPFNIRTTILDPPPVGYQMTGVISTFHLEVHGITANGSVVSMAQSAYPVIPFLFDPEAQFALSAGIRLTVLPAPVTVGTVEEFAAVVSGSHDMLVTARVVTGLQTGFNPAGVDLLILAGDVQYDATADVLATLELQIPGIDEDTGKSLFPRRPSDLLAPYGTEVFVARGVDLGGGGNLSSPLGYFTIRSVEQDDAPYGPIRLSCQDRMAGIIEARPLTPREFRRTRTVGSVFATVVGEVYPTAIIAFDDDSAADTLGRTLVMEESRYEVLLEIADSLGKVVYWDGQGILRVETAPDDTVPLWEVKAGRNGVLVTSGRRVTRNGVFNGVVATGEAVDSSIAPVRAVVVDRGPSSPTRWASVDDGGFGFVPRFYASPFIRTNEQARTTAQEMLRRSLGAPYSVDFGSVVNPALRPWHPIRVTQQDGNRERHVVDRNTVPLVASAHMTGSTREVTQVVIGVLPG